MALTGRFWFKKTWRGRLVLLVEEKRPRWFSRSDAFTLRWRDATLMDFAESALRPLLNLEHSLRPPTSMTRAPGLHVIDTPKPSQLAAAA
ncbi:hypothetical protein FV217_07815 [Methylobacterium sp. WL9]|nr:hypothetical protein FV217_07815 [Methylobacterium sp. WL9]